MLSFLLLLVLVVGMFLRNSGAGFLIVAFVWIAAALFNPNVDSGVIWVLGFGLGYLLDVIE